MNLSDAILKRILFLMRENKISLYFLSMSAGVPYSTLNDFINRKTQTIRLETLLHICEGLNISLGEFFSHKIFNDVEAE